RSRVSSRMLNNSRSTVPAARYASASDGTTYSAGRPPGPATAMVVNVTADRSDRSAGSTTTRGRSPDNSVYSTRSPVKKVTVWVAPGGGDVSACPDAGVAPALALAVVNGAAVDAITQAIAAVLATLATCRGQAMRRRKVRIVFSFSLVAAEDYTTPPYRACGGVGVASALRGRNRVATNVLTRMRR